MTLPTIVPVNFNATVSDFTKVKAERSGALRTSAFTVSVPSGTASATVIGLVPVKKGARIVRNASSVFNDQLDTSASVTAALGIVYTDTTTNTSVPGQFTAAGSVALQSTTSFTLLTAYTAVDSYVVTGDGWIAVTTAAAATNNLGTIHGAITITYDSSLQ